ncbi:DMT family transporter [Georgenia sp. EYE_87]|uniref:DMT family transporter n=1 Tax=Georgenia sp. EYE_87 TaxID=2853448 RepID=UPI002005E25A|nr:DMT family transporter [Georgenia sp. EYE_87]MCK6211646.1 DMT family transporter [Georgenia sp. EYE_87]
MALSADAPARVHEITRPGAAPAHPTAAQPVPAHAAAGPTRPAPAGDPARNRRLGVVAIVVSATAMGTAGVFGRLATPSGALIGEALTMGRMLVGAVGMLVILAVGRRLGVLRRTRLSWSVALGGVFLGLSLATLLSATVLIDLALAVALHYLGPVLSASLAWVLLKESMTRVEVVSLVISFAGMTLAAGLVGGDPAVASGQEALGLGLGVASGIFYGAALLCYRYRTDMPADVRSFWNFAFGALGTAALVAVVRPDLSGMTATHWAWAAAFFLVCGLLALGLLVVAGKHLRAAELSGLSYWEVVVALLLGAALFGEGVSALAAAGAGLIVIAGVVPLLGPARASSTRAR